METWTCTVKEKKAAYETMRIAIGGKTDADKDDDVGGHAGFIDSLPLNLNLGLGSLNLLNYQFRAWGFVGLVFQFNKSLPVTLMVPLSRPSGG